MNYHSILKDRSQNKYTSLKNDSSRYSIGKKVANQPPNNSFFVTHICHRPRSPFWVARYKLCIHNVKVEEEEENVGAATAAAAAAVLSRNGVNFNFKFGITR